MNEYMSINDFVEMTGYNKKTILRAVRKIFPDKIRKGVKTLLDKLESEAILKDLRVKDMPNMDKNVTVAKADKTDDLKEMFKGFMLAQQQTNQILLEMIKENKTQPKQIEIKQDYYSILGYCRLNSIEIKFSDAVRFGKIATKESNSMNMEIRKTPDERYGQVNSYSIKVLDKVFSL